MSKLVQLVRRDSGVSLTELMITMVIVAILGSIMVSWIVGLGNANKITTETQLVLDDMRFAKSQLVKEIRFADGVIAGSSDAHTLTLWLDDPAVGVQGSVDASIGEVVTWEIHSDGRLSRDTDLPAQTPEDRAAYLVYDGAAAAGSSFFTYPSSITVEIELVADVDGSSGPSARTVRTEVHLRNA